MPSFIDELCTAIADTSGGDAACRSLIGRTIVDTLAVAAAGFGEPVVRACASAYEGTAARTWSGEHCESTESAILLNAIAAHALDFDDVYLESMIHPSAVLVPVVLHENADHTTAIEALAAGLIAGKAIASRLGPGHYQRGWHGTGTIGVFAATAAASKLFGLTGSKIKSALSLAAAMSGGLQINFSTMAKACHAGFAAAAGFRAARLAAAGVTGAPNVFAPGGYVDLYGDPEGSANVLFDLRPDEVALKLYPSCYAANRLVGIALDARSALGPIFDDVEIRCKLRVPAGSLRVLRFAQPIDGLQAKFSAAYNICVALLDGAPGIQHFSDAEVQRTDIKACMSRLSIVEDPSQPSGGDIRFGKVTLEIHLNETDVAAFTRSSIPGSAEDPATRLQFREKTISCLAKFSGEFGREYALERIAGGIPEARAWFP
jgi:2-methylcitrate dehydratase PrpD